MPKKKASKKDRAVAELSDKELDGVSGGATIGTPPPINDDIQQSAPIGDSQIASPRDPASGLPTGKRMHKPFTIT